MAVHPVLGASVKSTPATTIPVHPQWDVSISESEWEVYRRVMEEARAAGVRFAFGGAFATGVYTGDLRNTKDFDFYILPEQRDAMIEATRRAGLRDYYDTLPYDRAWIYRASTEGIIVDTIWAMANLRTKVEERWISAGPEVRLRGELIRAIPIEDLIWSKLYVIQRERCDWGDVLNLIDAQAGTIAWERLIDRMGDDAPLLAGALSIYAWLAPAQAAGIPSRVWNRLGIPPTSPNGSSVTGQRARLIDSRPWFRLSREPS
jgi:hypothetical protein